jgi:hypothetical protein
MLKQKPLRLPFGRIVAELGLRHLGGAVTAAADEAYVVVQRTDRSHWYAAWQPYAGRWDEVELDAEDGYAVEPRTAPLAHRAVTR